MISSGRVVPLGPTLSEAPDSTVFPVLSGGQEKVRIMKSDSKGRAKSTATPKDVDEYLASVPEPARATLNKVRAAIRSVVPGEDAEYISYKIPMFRYKGALVAFAAFSKHCSFFPMSYAVIKAFQKELKDCTVSKGTIRFPVDKPLPAALIKKMVKARIAEKDRKVRE